MNTIIKERWKMLWHSLQARSMPMDVFDQLISAYSAPDRFYHNLNIEQAIARLEAG